MHDPGQSNLPSISRLWKNTFWKIIHGSAGHAGVMEPGKLQYYALSWYWISTTNVWCKIQMLAILTWHYSLTFLLEEILLTIAQQSSYFFFVFFWPSGVHISGDKGQTEKMTSVFTWDTVWSLPAFSWKLEGRGSNLSKMSRTGKLSSFLILASDLQIIMQIRKYSPTVRADKVSNSQWVDSGHALWDQIYALFLPQKH